MYQPSIDQEIYKDPFIFHVIYSNFYFILKIHLFFLSFIPILLYFYVK